jgi:hypothetical protein
VDGGERRIEQAGGIDIVEADDGHIARNGHASPGQGPEYPDGHLVVGAHDRLGQLPAVPDEQFFPGLLAAPDAEDAVHRADDLALRIAAQHMVEGESPLDGVGCIRRPVDVEQPPHAVLGDEVSDDRSRAGKVVGRYHVGRTFPGCPGYDHHGHARGEAFDDRRGNEPFADQDPVGLARERMQPGHFLLAHVI